MLFPPPPPPSPKIRHTTSAHQISVTCLLQRLISLILLSKICCWIAGYSSPEKCLTEVSISLGIYNRFSAVFQMIHCNNGCLQNRRLDIQNLGYVSCSLFSGYDIQHLKWLEMQRHALSYAGINLTSYHPPSGPLIFSVKISTPGTAFQC